MNYDDDDDDAGFVIIGSAARNPLQEVKIQQSKIRDVIIYRATIKPSRNNLELNLIQNQYYQLNITKKQQQYSSSQFTFEQFTQIYQILVKKDGGYIFPAFPDNDILSYFQRKVTVVKNEELANRKIRMIERFFNLILKDDLFDPENCQQLKKILQNKSGLQTLKQINNSSKGSILNISWAKIKNIFVANQENKYIQQQQSITEVKNKFQVLYGKCRQMINLLKEELDENAKLSSIQYPQPILKQYCADMLEHDQKQQYNLLQLEQLQFDLFCQIQDLNMSCKIIDKMKELKKDQDNYAVLKNIDQSFNKQFGSFVLRKQLERDKQEDKLNQLFSKIRTVAQFKFELI